MLLLGQTVVFGLVLLSLGNGCQRLAIRLDATPSESRCRYPSALALQQTPTCRAQGSRPAMPGTYSQALMA